MQPETWVDVLKDISASINAKSGLMSIDSTDYDIPVPVTLIHHGYDPLLLEQYFEYYHGLDVWTQLLNQAGTDRFLSGDDLISLSQLKHSELYQDWLRFIDVAHATGAYMEKDNDLGLRIAFQRNERQGPFDADTVAYLDRLRPHLLRSVRIGRQISQGFSGDEASLARQVGLDRPQRSPDGIILLDSKLECLRTNDIAGLLLKEIPCLDIVDDRLRILGNSIADGVTSAITRAACADYVSSPEPACFIVPANNSESPEYVIEISPLRGAPTLTPSGTLSALVVMTIKKLGLDGAVIGRRLTTLYGLSNTEIEIATAVGSGKSPEIIARERGRSVGTVRTQIRNILAKTNTGSMTALAALVNQL